MAIPVRYPTSEEMWAQIARFDELVGDDDSFPDSPLPGHRRTIKNVVGFEPPEGEGQLSPVGAARPRITTAAGFGVAFIECQPGHGPPVHNHDTNETFIGVEGTWKVEWEGTEGREHVILGPKDTISVPPGVYRRFECVSPPEGKEVAILLGVIGGDSPGTEPSPETLEEMAAAGLRWSP
jgi:mannose-6-phosphate isomerase-like protein (cupin superfamily)